VQNLVAIEPQAFARICGQTDGTGTLLKVVSWPAFFRLYGSDNPARR
jgi:hypothetical protein